MNLAFNQRFQLDALCLSGPIDLIGWSLGGMISILFTELFPKKSPQTSSDKPGGIISYTAWSNPNYVMAVN